MFNYIWPVILVVLSNTIYQISAKSVPDKLNPFASLTITYLVGAIVSGILYYVLNKDANLIREYSYVNWAPFALGFAVVGLEVGFVYGYKAGWPVSTYAIVTSAFLAIVLLFVGYLIFSEAITLTKAAGMVICLVGLYFINK